MPKQEWLETINRLSHLLEEQGDEWYRDEPEPFESELEQEIKLLNEKLVFFEQFYPELKQEVCDSL